MPLTDILPVILELTPPEKIRLIRLLAEDLDSQEKIFPFQSGRIFELHTPYNCFGAAQILALAMTEQEQS